MVLVNFRDESNSPSFHLIHGELNGHRSESVGEDSNSDSGIGCGSRKSPIPGLAGASLISNDIANLLSKIDGQTLEAKLRKILADEQAAKEDLAIVKSDLEEEKNKNTKLEEIIANGQNDDQMADTHSKLKSSVNNLNFHAQLTK